MKSKIFYLLAICNVILTDFGVLSSTSHQYISDCNYDSVISEDMGVDNLTFICISNHDKAEEFLYDDHFKCSNSPDGILYDWTGTIDFRNCRFDSFQTYFFEKFHFMHTLNISDLELKKLEMKTFLESKNLRKFDASRNHLTEIPPMLFINAINLWYVDFSKNYIQSVMPLAFADAIGMKTLDLSQNQIKDFETQSLKDQVNLKMLNLSHNQMDSLDLRNLSARNLLSLDVSNNFISMLADHSFDELSDLRMLNLSFNPIGNFRVETFAHLSKLEYLNLRRTNIFSIELGSFSHQHKLIALDLSDNRLKELDFNLFLPSFDDILSLNLAGNELSELTDFHNSLFPKLNEIGIKNNRFNCSYLQQFLKSVDWKNVNILVDPKSIDAHATNIRGIQCEKLLPHVPSNVTTNDGNSSQVYINGDLYVKASLVFVCILNSVILIIFLCLNRDRIFKSKRMPTESHSEYKSELSPSQIVEYSNEKIILK